MERFGKKQDPRLDNFNHYLVANELALYRRVLLEQVALQEFEMQGEVGRNMERDVARTARDTLRQMNTQIEQEILF